MRTKIYVFTSLMLLTAFLAGCAGGAFAQSATPPAQTEAAERARTINVSGSGIAYLTPDMAHVTIGVHTEGKNAAEAVAQNDAAAQDVLDALKGLGIAEKDIQTTNFSIYPQQQYDPQGRPTGEIIYMVDNSVMVTVRDLDQIGEVLDAAVEAGANSISGVQFDVTDKTAALAEARKAAVADAQAKAEQLAEAAGVGLGDVQTINESSGYPTPIDVVAPAMMAEQAAAAVPISAGQMTVTVNVNIVYLIQ